MKMTAKQPDTLTFLQPDKVFTSAELNLLLERIKGSGELGRSSTYASLLEYLLQCSSIGTSPKEIEIAMEVLGKNADFDVSRESSVRVYVHQLRKKLDSYYQKHEPNATYRIVIPKGQYAVAAIDHSALADQHQQLAMSARPSLGAPLLITVAALLCINLVVLLMLNRSGTDSAEIPYANSSIWASVMDDDLPIMLVMGDYYIFGELNEQGNIGRMVRDFTINSSADLEERHFSDWETTHNYQDLDLSYTPEGSASALARIIPILSASGKRLNVSMMSDLTTTDVRENHIIYIGYISALELLNDIVFAASNLQVGRSYDELLNLETGRYFTSDAGLPEDGQQFRDYGFFSTFPASSENQVIVVGGMRDAGLIYTAQALSDQSTLTELEGLLTENSINKAPSLEVLYEVYGVDRTQFDGNLVYSDNPDPNLKWRQNLLGY